MIEIRAEFTIYCTECKTHIFTKFPDLHKMEPASHSRLIGPLEIGICRCGNYTALRADITQEVRATHLINAPYEDPAHLDKLKKAQETLI